MATSKSDAIFNQFAQLEQVNEECNKILAKSKKYIIISIASVIVFWFIFLCISLLKLKALITVFFLLWVAFAIGTCYLYSNKYMFIGIAMVLGRLMKIPVLGLILFILYFAIWFLITIMFPFVNVLSVTTLLKKQVATLSKSIEQIKAHPDFKKMFEKK